MKKHRLDIFSATETHYPQKTGTQNCPSCLHARCPIKKEKVCQLTGFINFDYLLFESLCCDCIHLPFTLHRLVLEMMEL